jgi:hypothetical protein
MDRNTASCHRYQAFPRRTQIQGLLHLGVRPQGRCREASSSFGHGGQLWLEPVLTSLPRRLQHLAFLDSLDRPKQTPLGPQPAVAKLDSYSRSISEPLLCATHARTAIFGPLLSLPYHHARGGSAPDESELAHLVPIEWHGDETYKRKTWTHTEPYMGFTTRLQNPAPAYYHSPVIPNRGLPSGQNQMRLPGIESFDSITRSMTPHPPPAQPHGH